MGPLQREVLRIEVALPDEVVLLSDDRAEVGLDDAQDQPQALRP